MIGDIMTDVHDCPERLVQVHELGTCIIFIGHNDQILSTVADIHKMIVAVTFLG